MYLLYDRVGELPLDQVIGQSDHNLFFDPAGGSYTIETRVGRGRDSTAVETKVYGLAEWRRWGFETNSLIGDPLFVDREHGDYRLRPGVPGACARLSSHRRWQNRPAAGGFFSHREHRVEG